MTAASESGPAGSTERAFWWAARQLIRGRWIIIGITSFAAVAAVVISLMLPNWYRADTRLLIPGRASSGLLSGLLGGSLSPAASSLLGGIVSDYQRQLAILDSRAVQENVVRTFDLVSVYELGDADAPAFRALQLLRENTDFVVDNDFNYLSVRVYDKDPERAAEMANFFVQELNRVNAELASQTAGAFRQKIESRYLAMQQSWDSVSTAVRDLQERTGIMDLPTQGAAFLEGLKDWRLEILEAEIYHDRLLVDYGPNNSQVQSAGEAVAAAKRKYQEALEGEERLLPVAQDSLPEVALQFAELEKEGVILVSLLEFVRPVLEEARLEEEREAEAIQVVDPAVPPVDKARPWRAAICVAATVSGFLLSVFYVLLMSWWREVHPTVAKRLAGEDRIAGVGSLE